MMGFRPTGSVVGGLLAIAALSGCVGRYQSDFPVVVVNKAVNAIDVLANGNDVGQVAPGQTGSFSLKLQDSNPNILQNGVAPTPQAQVTFTAKDLKTGSISAAKSMTLSQDAPTYVTFSSTDFPSSVPTIARFTPPSPNNPGINQDVFFNASSSSVSNGTFGWDFGDGQTGSGVTVTHQYARAGTYTVVLTVTSDAGQTSTASRTVTVSASLPFVAANFTFSPTAPAINQSVLFTASTVPGVENFSWDFGDGATGSGATITHRYGRSGTYTVGLRVSNAVGQSAMTARPITVSANLPAGSVNFIFSPTTPGIGDTVFFNASLTTVANATFAWDFGDGLRGSGVSPTHQYAAAQTYTVTLTVANDLGQSASISKTVTVSSSSTQLVADFTFSPTDPTISRSTNTVIFDATPSGAGATAWTWDFGDGSPTTTGQKTSHTFSRAGTWVVRLTINDSAGRTSTTTKSVTVAP
jgi:PKD repeat protein